MKILLTQFATYNLWANSLMLECVSTLPQDLRIQKMKSSFGGIIPTLLHLWDAESIWWQRMKLQEVIVRPSENFGGNYTTLQNGLMEQSKQWHEWVLQAQPHMLEHEFIYNVKKEIFKQPVAQTLTHVFNHSTYHRGQLVTLLRQLEVGNIPQTDFIAWSRRR